MTLVQERDGPFLRCTIGGDQYTAHGPTDCTRSVPCGFRVPDTGFTIYADWDYVHSHRGTKESTPQSRDVRIDELKPVVKERHDHAFIARNDSFEEKSNPLNRLFEVEKKSCAPGPALPSFRFPFQRAWLIDSLIKATPAAHGLIVPSSYRAVLSWLVGSSGIRNEEPAGFADLRNLVIYTSPQPLPLS